MTERDNGWLGSPATLAESVRDQLRDAILWGDRPLGSPLQEPELCKLYNVSRVPVREALRSLHEEGLVEIIPHRGAFVTLLTVRQLDEIRAVRSLVESYAVRLAVEQKSFSERDLQELESLVRRLDDELTDEAESIKLDWQFHLTVCERCNNNVLLSVLKNMRSRTMLYVMSAAKLEWPPNPVPPAAFHRPIMEAIRRGDSRAAEEAVRLHIEAVGRRLLARMGAVPVLDAEAGQLSVVASRTPHDSR